MANKWLLGQPVQSDNTNFEWVLGQPNVVIGEIKLLVGTADAITTAAAVLSTVKEVIGTTGATSSVTGHLTAFAYITGTVDAVTTVTGVPSVILRLVGTTAATTTVAADLSITKSIIGTSTIQSTAAGLLTKTVSIVGSCNGITTASGTVKVTRRVVGAADIQSVVTGQALTILRGLVGTADAVASCVGLLSKVCKLVSVVSMQSSATAVQTCTRELIGNSSGTTTFGGQLSVQGDVWLQGATAATTTAAALISLLQKLVGTVGAQTGTTVLLGLTCKVVGTSDAQSSAFCSLTSIRFLSATCDAESTLTGALKQLAELVGTVASSSSVVGSLTVGIIYGLSNYAENKFLEHLVGKNAFAIPSIALGLCVADPGEGGTGADCNEVANANGYARVALAGNDWNSAVNGQLDNTNPITLPEATGGWGTVSYYAIFDDEDYGQGNMLVYDKLNVQRVIDVGCVPQFAPGELKLQVN